MVKLKGLQNQWGYIMDEKAKRYIELYIHFSEDLGRFLTKSEQDFLKWLVIKE
jgi:hypothetical protein